MRGGQIVSLNDAYAPGLVVKPEIASKQIDEETLPPDEPVDPPLPPIDPPIEPPDPDVKPRRYHGTVVLDTTRVGRDASQIADEVIAHLSGLVGASVTVTLDVEAEIPDGAPDNVVRTVTENSQTLKFTSHGFEKE